MRGFNHLASERRTQRPRRLSRNPAETVPNVARRLLPCPPGPSSYPYHAISAPFQPRSPGHRRRRRLFLFESTIRRAVGTKDVTSGLHRPREKIARLCFKRYESNAGVGVKRRIVSRPPRTIWVMRSRVLARVSSSGRVAGKRVWPVLERSTMIYQSTLS